MLTDFSRDLGPNGTMIFGGQAAHFAWVEARSSFGSWATSAATVLPVRVSSNICWRHISTPASGSMTSRPYPVCETLRRCRERDVISDHDVTDLQKLMELRNPLSHFRHFDDGGNLDRRSLDTGQQAADVVRHDAIFAISLALRMLANLRSALARDAARLGVSITIAVRAQSILQMPLPSCSASLWKCSHSPMRLAGLYRIRAVHRSGEYRPGENASGSLPAPGAVNSPIRITSKTTRNSAAAGSGRMLDRSNGGETGI
ncbi:MAG: hypothetical protein R3D80_21120 [Paracoccaceae bacterium]